MITLFLDKKPVSLTQRLLIPALNLLAIYGFLEQNRWFLTAHMISGFLSCLV